MRVVSQIILLTLFVSGFPGVGDVDAKPKWTSYVDPSLISEIVLHQGELYIASSGGLLIFDPATQSFEQFTNTIGLPSNFLTALVFDNFGSIYVGTEDAGIARLDFVAGGFNVTPINSTFHGLSDDRITSVTAWGDTIVYGTKNGAGVIIQGVAGARFDRNDGLPSEVISDVFADGDRTWMATDSGVVFLDRLGFIRERSIGLPSVDANVFTRNDTALWVGTGNGVARYNPVDDTWIPDGLQGEPVFSLSFDGQRTWAGTRGRLYENDGSGWVVHGIFGIYAKYQINNTISEIRGLQPMGDGTAYLGIADAVSERRGGHLIFFDGATVADIPVNAPPMNQILRLSVDIDNSVWISTSQFGVGKLAPDGTWFGYNNATGDVNLTWRCFNIAFLADSQGIKWFNVPGLLIDRLDDGLDLSYANDVWSHDSIGDGGGDGVGSLRNVNAKEDPGGNRWFLSDTETPGQLGISILSRDESAWRNITPTSTGGMMEDGNVLNVAFDNTGSAFVGLRKYGVQEWITGGFDQPTLFDLTPDTWAPVGEIGDEFDSAADILALAVRSDGVLWVGTSVGVYKREAGANGFKYFPPNRGFGVGLLGPEVNDLVLDHDENLWVATNLGLNRIDRDDDNDISSFTTPIVWQTQLSLFFPPSVVSPLVEGRCNALVMHPTQDILYIATDGGLSAYDFSPDPAATPDLSGIFLYPNPVKAGLGHRELKIGNINSTVTVEVFTLDGELVQEEKQVSATGDVVWDLTSATTGQDKVLAASGIYLVRITTTAGTLVKRVAVIQ